MLLGTFRTRPRNDKIKKRFFTLPPTLNNFEIHIYYQKERRFNGVFSRYINFDECKSIGTHWVSYFS